MMKMLKEATSSVTLENVVKEHIFAATHTHSLKSVMEKTITLGKLEGSVKVHITIYIYYSMVFISEFVWSLGILSCVFRLFEHLIGVWVRLWFMRYLKIYCIIDRRGQFFP